MSAGHIFFKGRYLHFITLQIWDAASPICSLLLLLTCSVPRSLSPSLSLSLRGTYAAFRWLQILEACLFRWFPRTFLLKKSKHTVLIRSNEVFIFGFTMLDGIFICEHSKISVMNNAICKPRLENVCWNELEYHVHCKKTKKTISHKERWEIRLSFTCTTANPNSVNYHLAHNQDWGRYQAKKEKKMTPPRLLAPDASLNVPRKWHFSPS